MTNVDALVSKVGTKRAKGSIKNSFFVWSLGGGILSKIIIDASVFSKRGKKKTAVNF